MQIGNGAVAPDDHQPRKGTGQHRKMLAGGVLKGSSRQKSLTPERNLARDFDDIAILEAGRSPR